MREYELCTVTYGVSSAPFLAIRCLRQLDQDDGPDFPLAKNILVSATYVDDIFVGADSIAAILNVQSQINGLLVRGGFELKKWASNCAPVLQSIAPEDRATGPLFEPKNEQAVKVLGIHWDTNQDTFGYHSTIEEVTPTKRSVLSTIARLYDPIEALSPTIFWAKCLMQKLWVAKLDWDMILPPDLALDWHQFITELDALSQVTISRHIPVSQDMDVQMVGFCDTSQQGYAATVFLRVVEYDLARIYFLTCKTKVVPLKCSQMDISLTIPRLELCAAFLLARVMAQQLRILQDKVNITAVRAWSDSTIVLGWLSAEQRLFKIFVTNRVAKIKSLIPHCVWAHINTKENPADPASRGILPNELTSCFLFFQGPRFLYHPVDQ